MSQGPRSRPADGRFAEILDRPLPAAESAAQGQEAGRTLGSLFDSFMSLSRVLVGRTDLADWLGRAYLGTLVEGAVKGMADPTFQPHYSVTDILDTLAVFHRIAAHDPTDLEREVQSEIVAAGNQTSVVAKAMIALWYCAGLIDQTPPPKGMGFLTLTAPIETYPSALIWQTVGGNPMGIPGPYYGNWSYPATTPIVPPPPRAEGGNPAAAGEEGDR